MTKAPIQTNYQSQIMEIGSEFIRASHPDAINFKYIGTKDFVEGRLTTIEFDYENKTGFNYIYDRAGKYEYARNSDMLIAALGGNQRYPSFLETILRPANVAGIIAIVLLLLISIMALLDKTVPAELWPAFTLVLGFYFGSKKKPKIK